MARFAQYAMAATEEALEDAGWKPTAFEQREMTVCMSVRCCIGEVADVCLVSREFV